MRGGRRANHKISRIENITKHKLTKEPSCCDFSFAYPLTSTEPSPGARERTGALLLRGRDAGRDRSGGRDRERNAACSCRAGTLNREDEG